MSQAAELLKTLDAQKYAIVGKQKELQGYLDEKTETQRRIAEIESTVLPELRKQKLELEGKLSHETQAWSMRKSHAYRDAYDASWKGGAAYELKIANANWTAAKNAAQTTYNEVAPVASLWYNRFHVGCNWTGATTGFQGSYCGDFAAGCRLTKTRNSHDLNQEAPSHCLASDIRKTRNQHAETQARVWATNKQNAATTLDSANKKPNAVLVAEQNRADSIAAYNSIANEKEPMASISRAIGQKDLEIQAYTKTGGKIDGLKQRIAFIDSKITDVNKNISELNAQRDMNEVQYQKLLAEEIEKQRLMDEQAKLDEFNRSQKDAITKASIQANLAGTDPAAMLAKAKSSSDNKMYMLAGLGLLVAGIYVIKKK